MPTSSREDFVNGLLGVGVIFRPRPELGKSKGGKSTLDAGSRMSSQRHHFFRIYVVEARRRDNLSLEFLANRVSYSLS